MRPTRQLPPQPKSHFIDRANAWLTALQAIAVILGVVIALYQLRQIARQTEEQTRQTEEQTRQTEEQTRQTEVLASQTEVLTQTLKATKEAQSATLVLSLRAAIEAGGFKAITRAIQNHAQTYKLSANGFADIDIEAYLGELEDIGLLVRESPLLSQMAYDHFSYDFEKAWCNQDVQRVILAARKADKSANSSTDAIYGELEKLARSALAREHQTCADMDRQ
jgi:hypothetical protein